MSEKVLEKPDCGKCVALCCRKGTVLRLRSDEAEKLGGAKNLLVRKGTDERRDTRLDHELIEDCIHLTAELGCALHGTDDKPLVCGGGFPVGGHGCRSLWEAHFGEGRRE